MDGVVTEIREDQKGNWFCGGNQDFSLEAFSMRC